MAYAEINEHYIENFHQLTKNEMLVFCFLLKCRNSETGQCNPKLVTIAEKIRVGKGNVSRAVAGLEAKNWLVWEASGNFVLAEKVVDSTTSKIAKKLLNQQQKLSNQQQKSCQINNSKLLNQQLKVVKSTTPFKRNIEKTIEKTREEIVCNEKAAPNAGDPTPEPTPSKPSEKDRPTFGEALKVYGEYFRNVTLRPYQIEEINKTVQNIRVWRRVCDGWLLNDHNATNIDGLLDRYNNEVAKEPVYDSHGFIVHPKNTSKWYH